MPMGVPFTPTNGSGYFVPDARMQDILKRGLIGTNGN